MAWEFVGKHLRATYGNILISSHVRKYKNPQCWFGNPWVLASETMGNGMRIGRGTLTGDLREYSYKFPCQKLWESAMLHGRVPKQALEILILSDIRTYENNLFSTKFLYYSWWYTDVLKLRLLTPTKMQYSLLILVQRQV